MFVCAVRQLHPDYLFSYNTVHSFTLVIFALWSGLPVCVYFRMLESDGIGCMRWYSVMQNRLQRCICCTAGVASVPRYLGTVLATWARYRMCVSWNSHWYIFVCTNNTFFFFFLSTGIVPRVCHTRLVLIRLVGRFARSRPIDRAGVFSFVRFAVAAVLIVATSTTMR